MFQYALGRHLSVRNKLPLKMDVSFLARANRPFTCRLTALNIDGSVATAAEVARVKGGGFVKRLLARFPGFSPYSDRYVSENGLPFQESILEIKGSVYLDGYWGSENYFVAITDLLMAEFAVKSPLEGKNKETARLISTANSVSLHVRRGDYVSDPGAAKVLGTCPLDYYAKAVELICSKVSDPHFFVFSDDPAWVRENIRIARHAVTYVTHNDGEHEYEDLRLMALCRHNITANSSFSWWGAWLNRNPDKLVLAPAKWFADPSLDSASVTPAAWIRM